MSGVILYFKFNLTLNAEKIYANMMALRKLSGAD